MVCAVGMRKACQCKLNMQRWEVPGVAAISFILLVVLSTKIINCMTAMPKRIILDQRTIVLGTIFTQENASPYLQTK